MHRGYWRKGFLFLRKVRRWSHSIKMGSLQIMRSLLCGSLTKRRTQSEERAYWAFVLDIGKRRKFTAGGHVCFFVLL